MAARARDVATSCGGGATQRHSLSTCHADGAPVAVEEDAAAMAKLLLVCLATKSCKVVVGLLVGEEEITLNLTLIQSNHNVPPLLPQD
jgi:hypothetical protein